MSVKGLGKRTRLAPLGDEHQQLRLAADRLRLLAAVPSGVLTGKGLRSVVDAELRSFARLLGRHFEMEETGVYLGLDIHPELGHQSAALLRQHIALEEELAELVGEVETGARLAGIRRRIERFLGHLGSHEAAENALIQEAFLTDIGPGD